MSARHAKPLPGAGVTISALAAQLGDLEPASGVLDEVGPEHLARQKVVFGAANLLPVDGPADASLALSAAADMVEDLIGFNRSEAELMRDLERLERVLGLVARWVMTEHGAQPLRCVWAESASPFGASDAAGAPSLKAGPAP